VSQGIIRDLEGWYFPAARRFDAVVALGRDVAGFPRVVHGGLTAAIFDEARAAAVQLCVFRVVRASRSLQCSSARSSASVTSA
jgi:hypothetical protein